MAQNLQAVSISHHRAPVEIRERIALSDAEMRGLLQRLKDNVCSEAMILSTCNRTELYAIPHSDEITGDYLLEFLLSAKKLPAPELQSYKPYFERLNHCDAITHLFSVISGIDSQIIGDQQIFAQVKDAFRISTESQAAGGFLTKLAHSSFRVAKRVISETGITTGAATISYAAVEFARKIYDDLRNHHALIVGAGETAELAAKHLAERNIGALTILNRDVTKATLLLQRVRGDNPGAKDRVLPLSELVEALSKADIVISSTAATEPIISKQAVEEALKNRASSYPQVLIDIAVPRDIESSVGKISGVFLKDIDDLRSIVDQNLERRKAQIPKAKAIIQEELESFLATLSRLEVGPTIKELRDKVESIRSEELERHRAKLDAASYALVEEMTRKMMNRLMHSLMVSLKEPHGAGDDLLARVELVRELFALNNSSNE